MNLSFEVWDVFTSRPLTGNPLAVFLDANLTDDQMVAIARELNHSETTFVTGRAANGFNVRIFSPTEELPFAGHPVLGTAAALYARYHDAKITLNLKVGPVTVTFENDYGEMLQPEPVFTDTYTTAQIAPILGVTTSDLHEGFPIETVSTGRPNVLVMLRTLKAIRAARIDWTAARKLTGAGFYLMTTEVEDPQARAHARKLTRTTEDPATGSAAGCAAAWFVKHSLAKPAERVLIEQGSEIRRPSQIYVSAEKSGDKITTVRVGGRSVMVIRGGLTL